MQQVAGGAGETPEGRMDEVVGVAVQSAREAVTAAADVCEKWRVVGEIVGRLATEVVGGHGASVVSHAAAETAQNAVTGVWVWWQQVRLRLRPYRLILGGGASACGLAMAVLLWPKVADASPPRGGTGWCDGVAVIPASERAACDLITTGRYDEAEAACRELPDVRRYHLMGEIERAKGAEGRAVYFYGKAAAMGDRSARLCLTRTPASAAEPR